MRLIKLHDGVSTFGGDWFEDNKGIRHSVYNYGIPLLTEGDATFIMKPDANDVMRMMQIVRKCVEAKA